MDNTVAVLFSTTSNPFSWLIRLITWSRWSHVSIVDGDDVIEAHALYGVIRRPCCEVIETAKRCEFVRFKCDNPQGVIEAARSQVGKEYDWTALFGILLRRNWQEDDSWFCSELVAWCFTQADCGIFRADRLARVTPEHLWMLEPVK